MLATGVAYVNLTRVMNIVGIKPLLAAIRARGACTVVRAV
jgi:hypothetical protein